MGRAAKLRARRQRQRAAIHADLHRSVADMKEAAQDTGRITPEGQALGEQMVRLTEPVIIRLAAEGEPDTRCASCAFRAGTVPNGCPQTQLDAVKSVLEGVPFLCHLRLHERVACHGWYAGRVAVQGTRQALPYAFSVPEEG